MKKISTIAILLAATFAAAEDDLAYYNSLAAQMNELKQVEDYAKSKIYIIKETSNALATQATCDCNTFIYYLWREYATATPIRQLEIISEIKNLTERK